MASPAAKRLAEDLGIDLSTVEGTGDDGMITKEDVTEAATSSPGLSPMRQAIAEATSHAWATVPHVALISHADLPEAREGASGALTARVVRAAALALQEYPRLNGWLTHNRFQQATGSHIGVVVAVADGLVPVTVANADTLPVTDIAARIASLAEAARDGTLKGAQTAGASFTVSSLGRWGVDSFAPVISAPQVAILGVGRVRRVAREAAGGKVRFVNELGLTLVFDHRANDGVAAAECLAAIVAHLETPEGKAPSQ
jgi:pyruvate dehydrogenase E2 component (dihydrolipoamide acetyltransferase)